MLLCCIVLYCVVVFSVFFFLNYYETTQHNRYIQFHKFKRKNPSFFKNNTIHNSISIFLENNTIHNTISSFWKQYYSPLNLLVGDLEIWFFFKTILFSLARNLIFFFLKTILFTFKSACRWARNLIFLFITILFVFNYACRWPRN